MGLSSKQVKHSTYDCAGYMGGMGVGVQGAKRASRRLVLEAHS